MAPDLCASSKDPIETKTVLPYDKPGGAVSPEVERLYRAQIGTDKSDNLKVKEPETQISIMLAGKFSLAAQGKIGDSKAYHVPRYGRGWSNSQSIDCTLGMDVGFIGFFVNLGFDRFRSRGTTARYPGWYKYTDLTYFTVCPGLKIKFPYWLRNAYAGDAPWSMEWYDYMLHAFPYIKAGFGPAILNQMEKATDAQPYLSKYWESGLSFTGFISVGIQWSPFFSSISFFFEGGVQMLVPMTNMGPAGVGENPENLISFPIHLGMALEF
jgi:hypothetical protein